MSKRVWMKEMMEASFESVSGRLNKELELFPKFRKGNLRGTL